jgi:predicted amidohydrolase
MSGPGPHPHTEGMSTVKFSRMTQKPQPDRTDGLSAITFYGSSFVCDARGDKLAELDRTEDGIALATLDLAHIRRVRASMGLFRDRRR